MAGLQFDSKCLSRQTIKGAGGLRLEQSFAATRSSRTLPPHDLWFLDRRYDRRRALRLAACRGYFNPAHCPMVGAVGDS
jgi:hypothetical protein